MRSFWLFTKRLWLAGASLLVIQEPGLQAQNYVLPPLGPMPGLPALQPANSVPMGDPGAFAEVKMTFPIQTNGPFQPTWSSIAANYPANPPGWLRQAKLGMWVHYGPEAELASGDWSAQHMYQQGATAYNNHLAAFGYPATNGFKDVIHAWNPTNYSPSGLAQLYYGAGARFLLIQGVHHDQFDEWNSTYNPWNAVNFGPKRDTLAEWTNAARALGMRLGVAFHHEYGWWFYQPAYLNDATGTFAGVPYDAMTATNGAGTWWQNDDPRRLYLVNLLEYQGILNPGTGYFNPAQGIFTNHLAYANWYATQWALRMIDVIQNYDPDFIYTDGNSTQPFSGYGTGTGYKCDAMQRVMAHYYNEALLRRGMVDVFGFVKFHPPSGGVATTTESGYPAGIKTDQPWIAETTIGDWYYEPGITYDDGAGMIHWLLESVSRDGACAINICLKPDGSLDAGATNMLAGVGQWMRLNGEGIYGSRAWVKYGEGPDNLGGIMSGTVFSTNDFRFTVGSNGFLYAYCPTVPAAGARLVIKSLGTGSNLLAGAVASVAMLGSSQTLSWTQQAGGLVITCPTSMPVVPAGTGVGFKIGSPQSVGSTVPFNFRALPGTNQLSLSWNYPDTTATFSVARSITSGGPYTVIASGLTNSIFTDTNIAPGTLYFYVSSAFDTGGPSVNSSETSASSLPSAADDWSTEDIGAVAAAGSFVQSSSVFTVKGSGSDVWNNADAFHYVFQAVAGDCSITARVLNMQNTAPWAKAGVMIRESLDPAAQYLINFISPANSVAFQQRNGTGGSASGVSNPAGLSTPIWLRLVRSGDLFTGYDSPDGVNWVSQGTTTIPMNAVVYAGLEVCSVDNGTSCQAQFDQVSLLNSASISSPPLPQLIHRYSFNESDGRIVYDSIGSANGVLKGNARFDGQGHVMLDGTAGTYVSLPGGLLAGISNVTFEAWVTNAGLPDNVALFSFDDGTGDGVGGGYLRYVLHDQNDGRNFLELAGGEGSPLLAADPGLGGQSVHVVCVYNAIAGTATIYTNGVIEAGASTTAPLSSVSTNAAALGRSPWWNVGDPWLSGSLDEFRIYNGALQPGDILAAQAVGPNVLLTTNVNLRLSIGSGQLACGWPVAGAGFALQCSTKLGPDANWTPFTNFMSVGTNNEAIMTPSNSMMFFRLMR